MEGASATVYKGIKGYWRRKDYERINTGSTKRKTTRLAAEQLNSTTTKRRRFWRVKLTRRLKLKLRFSPKKFLVGLRDSYVNMMLKFANSRAVGGGSGGGFSGNGVRGLKEYDERVIVELYKTIVMAQGQIAPRDAAWITSVIAN